MHLQFRSVRDHRSLHDTTPHWQRSRQILQTWPSSILSHSGIWWTNFRHSLPHFSTLRWAAVLSQHLKGPLPSLQFSSRRLSIRTISATTDPFQTWRSYLSSLSVRRTNKLFATLTDFNYSQSCSLPSGKYQSTETATIKVMSDVYEAADAGSVTLRPSRPHRRVRHGRPSHSAWARLRCHGTSHLVDRVIPHGTQSIRAVQRGHLKDCTSQLRCASRVRPGADTLYLLLGRSRRHRSTARLQRCTRSPTTYKSTDRRPKTVLLILWLVCRSASSVSRHGWVKSTTAQSTKNRFDMARYESPIAALWWIQHDSFWCWRSASRLCSRSWCPDRQQNDTFESRQQRVSCPLFLDPTRPGETWTRPDPTGNCRQKVWLDPSRVTHEPLLTRPYSRVTHEPLLTSHSRATLKRNACS